MRVHAGAIALVVITTAGMVRAQEPQAASPTPSIVTRGEAVIRRAPDRAFVVAAVEARAKTPREAQQLNATTMTAVQQRIAAAGIGRDAVRTLGYSIQQEFDFANGRRTPRGYLARNSIEVRLDDVDRAGEIADLVVQAGATNVAQIRFELKDRAGAEREALRLAVVDARARAEAVAAGAGRSLDRVLRIEDSPRSAPQPYMAIRGMASAVNDQATTPIEAGELEIHAEVLLTIAIK